MAAAASRHTPSVVTTNGCLRRPMCVTCCMSHVSGFMLCWMCVSRSSVLFGSTQTASISMHFLDFFESTTTQVQPKRALCIDYRPLFETYAQKLVRGTFNQSHQSLICLLLRPIFRCDSAAYCLRQGSKQGCDRRLGITCNVR